MSVLSRRVLVLNRNWQPVKVISLARAICLLMGGLLKARILDPFQEFALFTWQEWAEQPIPEEAPVIHSAHRAFRVPEIIVLSSYRSTVNQSVKFSKRNVYRRDHHTCMYCGIRPGDALCTLDHVVPRVRGGRTDWTNVCLACVYCNRKKGGRDMQEAGMTFYYPGYRPTKPKFVISDIVGTILYPSWHHVLASS